MFWEIKQSAMSKIVELYIYSEVVKEKVDHTTWEIKQSETSADYFRAKLEECGEIDNINIFINSLGGSVLEGLGIYSQLKRCKAYKTVYIDGFACSIASVIAMAGDKIIMPRNTLMMIHNPIATVCGNSEQLRKAAEQLDVFNKASVQAYVTRSNVKATEEDLKKMMDDETYLTAMQCVEMGLADEFADEIDMSKAKQELKTDNFQQNALQSITKFFGRNFTV